MHINIIKCVKDVCTGRPATRYTYIRATVLYLYYIMAASAFSNYVVIVGVVVVVFGFRRQLRAICYVLTAGPGARADRKTRTRELLVTFVFACVCVTGGPTVGKKMQKTSITGFRGKMYPTRQIFLKKHCTRAAYRQGVTYIIYYKNI